ncbi:bacteriocin [Rodentibacter rarus]|uniref:P22AR C-terminal domain-containing protein n=1 Tax=Rodentibacter rarus TaxID=1908260 RepID=UPI00098787FE|nr:P22AR C-terminal domain-containing protein [Rodentibacter rarus]OOF37448.1 bacteriocin [Rodentibacter rarus]
MSNLQILSNSIRTFENLYSLTDLHQASGSESKHKPSNFIRLDTTKDLVQEIEKDSNTKAVKVIRGTHGGTYACEELVLAYATWISPKFHLVVLRAFLAMHRNEPKQLALPEPEKKFTFEFTEHELQQLSWSWFALLRCTEMCRVLEPALRQIGSSYAATVRDLGREYAYSIRQSHHTLSRITEQFQADQITNWRVLRHLRNYDPKKIGFQLDIL